MRILALDYGSRRLGFAVSDPLEIIATPLRVVEVFSEQEALKAVCDVSSEVEAEKLIVGLPVNMDGSHGEMAEKVKKLCADLKEKLNIPIDVWDERLTTTSAEKVLLEADMSRAKRKKVIDKVAAQIILQGYMDCNQNNF